MRRGGGIDAIPWGAPQEYLAVKAVVLEAQVRSPGVAMTPVAAQIDFFKVW